MSGEEHSKHRCYTVVNLLSGQYFHVPKHVPQKPEITDVPFLDVNWDDSVEENPAIPLDEAAVPAVSVQDQPAVTVAATVPQHHAVLEDSEIDDIGKNRLSNNSIKQMKWAVTLF